MAPNCKFSMPNIKPIPERLRPVIGKGQHGWRDNRDPHARLGIRTQRAIDLGSSHELSPGWLKLLRGG